MKLSQIHESQKMLPAVRSNFSKLVQYLNKVNKRLKALESGSKESGKDDPNAHNKREVARNSASNDAMARIYARDRAMDKVDTGSRNVYHKRGGHWDEATLKRFTALLEASSFMAASQAGGMDVEERILQLKDILQMAEKHPEIAAKFGNRVDDIKEQLRELDARQKHERLKATDWQDSGYGDEEALLQHE
jgi:hypothetical protein